MKEFSIWLMGWIGSVSIISVICYSSVYSCTTASQRYYEAQKNCMDNGGSWIADNGGGNGGYSAHCFRIAPAK